MVSVSPAVRWELGNERARPESRRWVGVRRIVSVCGAVTSTAKARASFAPRKGAPAKRKVAVEAGGRSFGKVK